MGRLLLSLQLHCSTQGASIAYTTEQGRRCPLAVVYRPTASIKKAKQAVRAKAIRIGYSESEEKNDSSQNFIRRFINNGATEQPRLFRLYWHLYASGNSEGIYVYRLDGATGALEYSSKITGVEEPIVFGDTSEWTVSLCR